MADKTLIVNVGTNHGASQCCLVNSIAVRSYNLLASYAPLASNMLILLIASGDWSISCDMLTGKGGDELK